MKTNFQPNDVLMADELNANFRECSDKADANHTHTISDITDFPKVEGEIFVRSGTEIQVRGLTNLRHCGVYMAKLLNGQGSTYESAIVFVNTSDDEVEGTQVIQLGSGFYYRSYDEVIIDDAIFTKFS